MKKLQILMLFVVCFPLNFLSCSDEEERGDTLVGTWRQIAEYRDNVLVERNIEGECKGRALYAFTEDGSFSFDNYELDKDDICYLREVLTGIWVNNDDGTYVFAFLDISGLDSPGDTLTIEFYNKGNKFSVFYTDTIDDGAVVDVEDVFARE